MAILVEMHSPYHVCTAIATHVLTTMRYTVIMYS